jgi:undecaprenyl-diphosphatase
MLDRPLPHDRSQRGLMRDLAALDQALYEAVTVTRTPALDAALRRLSAAADHSKISFAVAGFLALRPGRPRRAAVLGLAAIGVASTTANLLGKRLVEGGEITHQTSL